MDERNEKNNRILFESSECYELILLPLKIDSEQ